MSEDELQKLKEERQKIYIENLYKEITDQSKDEHYRLIMAQELLQDYIELFIK
ncbi:MAG: hypothetical protein MJ179_02430 [Treponema sp.]|nr:hypothetical protein [Treponema sp.]